MRIGGRRSIRLRAASIDAWLEQHSRAAISAGMERSPVDARVRTMLEKGFLAMGLYKGSVNTRDVSANAANTRGGDRFVASARACRSGRIATSAPRPKQASSWNKCGLRSKSGEFKSQPVAVEKPDDSSSSLTFRQLAQLYKDRHVIAKRLAREDTIDYQLKPLLNRFGGSPIATIKTADVEDFITELRNTTSKRNLPLSPASINRATQLLREMLDWAVDDSSSDGTVPPQERFVLIRPELEDNMRRRRISEAEETALLAAAPPPLRAMIICAIDTGMRRGEMFAVRWADINLNES